MSQSSTPESGNSGMKAGHELSAASSQNTAAGRTGLKCDMCGKPLKSKRFQISVFMRPERAMTVGPDCFKKEREAVTQMKARFTPAELDAKRDALASAKAVQS